MNPSEDIRIALRKKGYILQSDGSYSLVPAGLRPAEPKQNPLPPLDKSSGVEDRVLAKSRVRIIRKSTRLLDRDNLYSSVKSLVDGLCKAGLLRGDSEKEIELEVLQEKVPRKGMGTEILIEPL